MAAATHEPSDDPPVVAERWPVLKVPVPPAWKTWLEEAAAARAIPVAALIRSHCIRPLMIRRHDSDEGGD